MTRRTRPLAGLAVALCLLVPACAPKAAPPPVPGAPRFPDFIPPTAPADLAPPEVVGQHDDAWRLLQAGDLRGAERQFAAVIKQTPAFYPSHAGLGYVALARKDFKEAVPHFDRALAGQPAYLPALVGRGEAQLAAGDRVGALASFEAALAAEPDRSSLQERVQVLRFRGMQDDIAAARKAAEAGHLAEARQLYGRAIAASPESPFLHRELAAIHRQEGDMAAALAEAQRAIALDPGEPRGLILLGEIHEAQSEYIKAADAYASAAAIEPSDALSEKIRLLHERAAFAAMPAEFQAIEQSPTVTRAQLAALIGVRLDDLLKRARRRAPVVMTDTRGNWAAPWILAVTRAGVMEPFSNHTFQPNAIVRRSDLAAAASQALSIVAGERPRLAAGWRNARRRFPDLAPGHLAYPAASLAVEAGVMTPMDDGTFQLARPVTGAEALAAVKKLEQLAGSRAR